MKVNRDYLIVAGVLLLLALITVLAAVQQANQSTQLPILESNSNQPDGGRAFRLWLDSIGYLVASSSTTVYSIPNNAHLALVLEPSTAFTQNDFEELDQWITEGGTLLLAGDNFFTEQLLNYFGYTFNTVYSDTVRLSAANPRLDSPAVTLPVYTHVKQILQELDQPETASKDQTGQPLLATPQGLVAVRLLIGKGQALLLSAPTLLTNAGLKDSSSSQLVQNLIALADTGQSGLGGAWFDEWHHGQRNDALTLAGPEDWLAFTPAGHAILFAAIITFLAIWLSGQSFGRPLNSNYIQEKRAPLEHITALANLSRRAGHRTQVLLGERLAIKRLYAHRYHIDLSLSDQQFAEAVQKMVPNFDGAELARLLQKIASAAYSPRTSESDMVRLVREASQWQNEHANLLSNKG